MLCEATCFYCFTHILIVLICGDKKNKTCILQHHRQWLFHSHWAAVYSITWWSEMDIALLPSDACWPAYTGSSYQRGTWTHIPELSSSLRIFSLTSSSHCWRICSASSLEQFSSLMLSMASSLSPGSNVPVLKEGKRKKQKTSQHGNGVHYRAHRTHRWT